MDMAEQLHLPVSELNPDIEANLKIGKNIVIMPIASPTLLVAETMKYAKSISTDILVINVVTDEATGQTCINIPVADKESVTQLVSLVSKLFSSLSK